MRTKWQVMLARRDKLKEDLAKAEAQLEGYAATEFGKPCSGCGVPLKTEMDFADHFLVPDERYLNIGYCPTQRTICSAGESSDTRKTSGC